MAVILRAAVGAPVTSGLFFARALIHGRVFHSKHYEKVKQRNSYTIMFKEEGENCLSYGHIECFAKVRDIRCQCNVTASCSCSQWMYLAVINRLLPTPNHVEASDGAVKVTMQHIVKAYPAVDGNLVAVPLQHVINKVVFMDIMPKREWVYLSQFPNLVEKD